MLIYETECLTELREYLPKRVADVYRHGRPVVPSDLEKTPEPDDNAKHTSGKGEQMREMSTFVQFLLGSNVRIVLQIK
jgi:hypothetical protein